MVLLKEFKKKDQFKDVEHHFLSVVNHVDDDASMGTYFAIEKSLRRPNGVKSSIQQKNFLSDMSKPVSSEHNLSSTAHILSSTLRDYNEPITQFPLLGRRIISGLTQWGSSSSLKVPGEAIFIEGYWEWTEDVLSHSGDILDSCSIRSAVYASLYSYARDSSIFRAFCESWCPTTNTLHTITGEWSISLWDLHKLGGLPLVGDIYDETVPDLATLTSKDKSRTRFISRACDFLFMAYHHIAKRDNSDGWVTAKQWIDFWFRKPRVYKPPNRRKRYVDSRPKTSQDPSGNINVATTGSIVWTQEECNMFDLLGVTGDLRREVTYVAAFLSCWLCVFALPSSQNRVIRPSTFETATLMARGVTFSLAAPVLASIYRGLNHIANSKSPSHTDCYFPAHYVYGWLAFYFQTHHELEPAPPGPPMVAFSGAQGSKYFHRDAACELIHEGRTINIGCTMLNRNRHEVLHDNGTLEIPKLGYLMSMRSSCLVLRLSRYFHVEPYMPHRFSRQFGFCQAVPGVLRRCHRNRDATYLEALEYWHLLLYKGSQSRLFAPSHSLDWRDLTTRNFKAWWAKLNVTDLRENVNALLSVVNNKSSKAPVGTTPHKVPKVSQCKTHNTPRERPDDNLVVHISSSKDKSNRDRTGTHDGDSISDAGSDVDFKHKRRSKRSQTITDTEYDALDIDGFFDDVPEPSQHVTRLNLLEGDLELEVTKQIGIDNSLVDDANGSQPLVDPASNPRRGKELCVMGDLIGNNHSSSPASSHNTIDNPSPEATAETLEIQSEATGSPSIRPTAPSSSPTSSHQLTASSRKLFNGAIKSFGVELLTGLKGTPFHEVSKIRKEASVIYEGIEGLKGDPKPLKHQVESYITAVESFLKLQDNIATHQRPDQVEHAKHMVAKEIQQFKSGIAASLKKEKQLEMEIEALRLKLEEEKNSRTSFEDKVQAAEKRIAELEATPMWDAEAIKEFEEHKRQILDYQSSITPTTWIDVD